MPDWGLWILVATVWVWSGSSATPHDTAIAWYATQEQCAKAAEGVEKLSLVKLSGTKLRCRFGQQENG